MDLERLRAKYRAFRPTLTERSRGLWCAVEARDIGRGGIALVSRATGVHRVTIWRGLRELEAGAALEAGRVGRPGAGRPRAAENDPGLLVDLRTLVEPTAVGHPETPMLWCCKSLRRLADELHAMGHRISYRTVACLLEEAEYTLQSNLKAQEARSHPDRDAQFRYINESVIAFQKRRQPVISVDCKKKELIGPFKNAGREWHRKGKPERVKVHDFMIEENGKAIPYGVFDLTRNRVYVRVGIDHETASFAVRTIHRWWTLMGRRAYPRAKSLLITADGGGSNGSRRHMWKW